MIHIYSSNELSNSYFSANEEPPEDEEEEEEDQYIRGPTETKPRICPRCKKYPLEGRKYHNKDVWFCENEECGYLCPTCYSKLPDPSKRSYQAVLRCPHGDLL